MIEYALQDIDGNELNLSTTVAFDVVAQNSLTTGDDFFSWENKVVDKSSLPGAVKLGENRIRPRSVMFNYTRAVGEDSDAYRADENLLLMWLNKVVRLIDKTNNRQVKVIPEDHSAVYDPGGHKISGSGEFRLTLLDPFWEDETAQQHTQSLALGTTVINNLSNDGFLTAPPIIVLEPIVAVTSVQISITSTNEGIEILDNIFGTPGFTEMIIDCKEGTILLGDLDRRNKITLGTGFFQLPVGAFVITFVLSAAADLTMDWNERYFI